MNHSDPLRINALRIAGTVLLTLALAACGNSSDDDEDDPPTTEPPVTTPSSLTLLDALPEDGVTQADPGIPDARMSHFGYSDFALAVSGECDDDRVIQRSVRDLSVDFDALFEHNRLCPSLTPNGAAETLVEATRDSGDTFEVRHEFFTTTEMAPDLTVQDAVTTSREAVADSFQTFVDENLIDQLDLPDAVAAVVQDSVEALAGSAYDDLVNAEPRFGVTAERVTYASRRPDGSASSELTGLVVSPDTDDVDFAPRNSVIVLSHSTGVTPSDLDVSNGWYVVANLLAAQGYLVVAPDNWGRGGTQTEPETYLMATRTAANSLDLVRAVLADADYDAARASGTPQITIVGYSQGGHTALALWQALAAQAPEVGVPQVYAGAGPYNLYALARGVVEHADGTCADGPYCRFVTDDTTVPFLSERVLPGYVAYAAEDLMLDDLVDGEMLSESFVTGFLGNEAPYDDLKGLLQQSSFTNITGGLENLADSGTRFTLFHSEFDRLVPVVNTDELVPVLEPHFTVERRTEACNGEAYEAIFEVTDQVGISHALCGFEMLNDVYAELE